MLSRKVKDIDDDEWWNGQTGKQVIVLPVYSGGVSYYINNEEFLNINNETVTISSQRMSTCFIRPFVDIEKTYKKNMTYMHYNIYGENIKTDKSSDTEKVYQISPANPVIQVYAKVCRNQITIEATKITENALCTKSLAFSHSSLATLQSSENSGRF